MDNKLKIWKIIPEFNGKYSISDFGDIRNNFTNRVLKLTTNGWGYPSIHLSYKRKMRNITIHRLVCENFIGKRPEGMDINHRDGNKTNNKIENLEYMSRKDNINHALKNGLMAPVKGESHWKTKLTDKKVIEIREIYKLKSQKVKDIATMFQISKRALHEITHNLSWKHLIPTIETGKSQMGSLEIQNV